MVHISLNVFLGQMLIGLVNGSFYAILSLGLAVIFGLLRVINCAHGAQYMIGAFATYMLLQYCGLGYWYAIILSPMGSALFAALIERTMLSRLYRVDHLYGLLLTFGIAFTLEGIFRYFYGSIGVRYPTPKDLNGAINIGFMVLPFYRAWVVAASLVICAATWLIIEKTKLGSYLRASTEDAILVESFGINVPLLLTLTYAFGAALAALAGVLAAPMYQINSSLGSEVIMVLFAVVVVGGLGSVAGAIATGYLLGIVEALTRIFYPEASNIVIFVVMAAVLVVRPKGLFGREISNQTTGEPIYANATTAPIKAELSAQILLIGVAALIVAPVFAYPVNIMKLMCFALFAAAFNLLVGYVGLLSFGHAAFFGSAAYFTGYAMSYWGFEPLSAICLGALGAAGLGTLVGALAVRRSGIIFSMITLALGQMVYFFFLQVPFTGGEDGLQNIPRGKLLGLLDLSDPLIMYYFTLAIFLFGIFAVWRVVNSPFGNVLKAIRENEQRAISLGYRANRYKLGAFVISATIAGMAGATKVLVFQLASLTDIEWHMSGEVVLMTLLGGIGTLLGPIVGASLVTRLSDYLATSALPVNVVTGIVFIVCVMTFRRGIVGEITKRIPNSFHVLPEVHSMEEMT